MQQDWTERENNHIKNDPDLSNIMASHLPPRSEFHRTKGRGGKHAKRTKKRDSSSFITIFAFIFLLLPIIIGSIFFLRELNNTPLPVEQNKNFDTVEFDGNPGK